MVIEINQIKANLKKEFEIYKDHVLCYRGKQSTLTSLATNSLISLQGDAVLTTQFAPTVNSSMYRILFFMLSFFIFGIQSLEITWFLKISLVLFAIAVFILLQCLKKKTRIYKLLDRTENEIATFSFYTAGLLSSYYVIEFNHDILKIYPVSKGKYNYFPVFLNDIQIAQINKPLATTNNQDRYKLFLLDQDTRFVEVLSMFIIHLDSIQYGTRGSVYIGKVSRFEWSLSKNNKFYNPMWVSEQFPPTK